MRTIWNGSISFGLVNIPVGLALATTPKAKQSDVSFRTLHRECRTPIRQKRWCPTHERELGPDEIVKGWEVAKGEFVIVEDADLEAIQMHDDSRSIEIMRFVPLSEVDPVYLDRTYYLAPASQANARRPYVLLLEAMKQAEMGAVGRFVLRGAEYFCLIRPKGDALALETLFLAEDVRSQAEIDEAVSDTNVKEAELELANQVMQSLVGEFEPEELVSEYRGNLRAMLEAKLNGQEITKPEPVVETPVVDLMEALKASVAAAQTQKGSGDGTKRAASKGGSRKPRAAAARKSA
jgi:DNA end-binding protein Ku